MLFRKWPAGMVSVSLVLVFLACGVSAGAVEDGVAGSYSSVALSEEIPHTQRNLLQTCYSYCSSRCRCGCYSCYYNAFNQVSYRCKTCGYRITWWVILIIVLAVIGSLLCCTFFAHRRYRNRNMMDDTIIIAQPGGVYGAPPPMAYQAGYPQPGVQMQPQYQYAQPPPQQQQYQQQPVYQGQQQQQFQQQPYQGQAYQGQGAPQYADQAPPVGFPSQNPKY